MRADAVLEGGGVKGIGLVGALFYAETEKNIEWMNVAGTSAGAIIASLIAGGYKASEIKEIMFNLDFKKLKDEGFLDKFLVPGKILSILFAKGIYEGDFIEKFIADLLALKNVYTFKDLIISGESNPRYKYKLNVIASDISRGKLLVLPNDIQDYGIDPDDLSVAKAVRMSMSIPIFYEPVVMDTQNIAGMPKKCYIVDGGMLSNYPIWLFDSVGKKPAWPTIGFRLIEPGYDQPREITNPLNFITSIISTLQEAHDERHIQDLNFKRTIPVKTMGIKTTEFDITPDKRTLIYNSGIEAAKSFFASFSQNEYENMHEKFKRPQAFLSSLGVNR